MQTVYLWREVIDEEMARCGDSWENVVQRNMTDEELDANMTGDSPPDAWTIWTHERVYFPTVNDSRYGINSAPRNPSGERMRAIE